MTKIDLSDNVVIYPNPLYGIYVHSVQEMLVSRESETPDTDWRQKSFFSKHVSLLHKTITGSYRSKKKNQIPERQLRKVIFYEKKTLRTNGNRETM